jgi:phosphoglucosamine mutase
MLEHATTGDGLLTGLHLLARMAAAGRTLADLASIVTRLPQVLINVTGVDKSRVDSDDQIAAAVARAEATLAATGRVLLRPSGTEPMVRVMVEAPTEDLARQVAEELARVVRVQLS